MPSPSITITSATRLIESNYPVRIWVISTAPFVGSYIITADSDLTATLGVTPSLISDWFDISPNSQLTVIVTEDITLSLDLEPGLVLLDDTVVTALDADLAGFYDALNTVAVANLAHIFLAESQSIDIATTITDVATLSGNIGVFWGVNPVVAMAHIPLYELDIQQPLAGYTYPLLPTVTATVSTNSELDTLYDANLNGVKSNSELGKAIWGAKLLSGLNINSHLVTETIKYELTNRLLPYLLQPIETETELRAAIDSYLSSVWRLGWLQGSYSAAFTATVTLTSDPQTIIVNMSISPVGVLESIQITLSVI